MHKWDVIHSCIIRIVLIELRCFKFIAKINHFISIALHWFESFITIRQCKCENNFSFSLSVVWRRRNVQRHKFRSHLIAPSYNKEITHLIKCISEIGMKIELMMISPKKKPILQWSKSSTFWVASTNHHVRRNLIRRSP